MSTGPVIGPIFGILSIKHLCYMIEICMKAAQIHVTELRAQRVCVVLNIQTITCGVGFRGYFRVNGSKNIKNLRCTV